jgi:hypothetical protein
MRRTPLNPGTSQLKRSGPIGRITASRTSIFPAAESRVSPRKPIRPVSKKRARENRVRDATADRLWPDRHEGTVMCGCGRPECHRPADDLHETLSRARSGGDITSPDIWVPLSRVCHDEITLGPEWAYRAGLLKHNGPCCQGRRVCSRYAQPEAPKAEAS